ncbi:hypothetical protein AAMO2058_000904700 [Amorphochlora amoebiformis]
MASPSPPRKADDVGPNRSFGDVDISLHKELLIQKARYCAKPLEKKATSEEKENHSVLEMKATYFKDMIEYFQTGEPEIKEDREEVLSDDAVLKAIMQATESNIFRALPPLVNEKMIDPDDDEEVYYSNWNFLQIVYEYFFRFLIVGAFLEKRQILKKFVNMRFVSRLLELFDSEDSREREYLRMILIRIYAKAMRLRVPIRRRISEIFHEFTYSTERHNGITALLEVLGGIITGFALPVKIQHKIYLERVLLPMHKSPSLSVIHPQLSYCVTQFIDKDHTLAVMVLRGLFKFWPTLNSSKELLLLSELEEVLELTRAEEFELCLQSISRRLAAGICSSHFQICQRTLFFWHNDYIASMIAQYKEDVFPVVYPALKSASVHWNNQVAELSQNVLNIFSELDPELVDKCESEAAAIKKSEAEATSRRKKLWELLSEEKKPQNSK